MKKTLALLGAMLLSVFALCGCSNEAVLEESAIPLVTSIIQEHGGEASCVSVKITKKVSDKNYQADAKLNNGETVKIDIEDRGDEIYVTIP